MTNAEALGLVLDMASRSQTKKTVQLASQDRRWGHRHGAP